MVFLFTIHLAWIRVQGEPWHILAVLALNCIRRDQMLAMIELKVYDHYAMIYSSGNLTGFPVLPDSKTASVISSTLKPSSPVI